MTDRFADDLDAILEAEGWPKYTNDPDDRGGPTKGGITLATLAAWRRRPVTAADVRDLGEAEAREIYRERYIVGPRFSEIEDDLLAHQVIDSGVLHGQETAAKWLQQAIGGVGVDGRVGTFTLGALALADPHRVSLRFAAQRARYMGRIIADNYKARRAGRTSRDQARFAAGWLDRAMRAIDAEVERA